MAGLDREAGAPENLRRRAEVLPEKGHVFVSSIVTKLFAAMSSRSNDRK